MKPNNSKQSNSNKDSQVTEKVSTLAQCFKNIAENVSTISEILNSTPVTDFIKALENAAQKDSTEVQAMKGKHQKDETQKQIVESTPTKKVANKKATKSKTTGQNKDESDSFTSEPEPTVNHNTGESTEAKEGSKKGKAKKMKDSKVVNKEDIDNEDEKEGAQPKENKRKQKKAKVEVDPDAPKKPGSAYMIYSNEHRALAKKNNPHLGSSDMITFLGSSWRELSEEKKKFYQDKYEQEKAEYEKKLEEYKASDLYKSKQAASSDKPADEPKPKKVKAEKPEKPVVAAPVENEKRDVDVPDILNQSKITSKKHKKKKSKAEKESQ